MANFKIGKTTYPKFIAIKPELDSQKTTFFDSQIHLRDQFLSGIYIFSGAEYKLDRYYSPHARIYLHYTNISLNSETHCIQIVDSVKFKEDLHFYEVISEEEAQKALDRFIELTKQKALSLFA
jgi:hypothetical protein